MTSDRFNDLYASYGAAVYARCRRLLEDNAAAEDAAQETFLRVHRHIHAVPADEEAFWWISRIATNYCLNTLRDRKLRPTPVEHLPETADPASPEDRLADRDLGRRLAQRAPAPMRAAAWMYYVDGFEQQEIAEELGVSRRTVVNYLGAFLERGRKTLGRSGRA